MSDPESRGRRGNGRTSAHSSFQNAFREAGPYLTLGLELGLTMIVWSVIGYVLDRWLETMPWLTLAGVVVGMVSLFIQLKRAASKAGKGSSMKREEADN